LVLVTCVIIKLII